MNREKQQRAPFVEALENYCRLHMKAYHTPGHKLGQGFRTTKRNFLDRPFQETLASCMPSMIYFSRKGR